MIKPLTSLRFFFALLVFCRHVDFVKQHSFPLVNWVITHVFPEGYIGVSFFFILSGFILAYTYQQKIIEKKTSPKAFMIARFARIYPMHILSFLLAFPLAYKFITSGETPYWTAKLAANLLLIQSFFSDPLTYFSFNGVSWSISDEMFFYAMFPLIMLGFAATGKKIWLYALAAACIAIPVCVYFNGNPFNEFLFYINPLFRLVDFSLGILVYNIFRQIREERITPFTANMLELGSMVLLAIFFQYHELVPQNYRFACYYWLPMCLLIFAFAFQKGLVSRLISYRFFIILGEISFSFYLLHQIMIRYFFSVNKRMYDPIERDYYMFFVILLVSLGLSYLAHRFIEMPANVYLKKKLLPKKTREKELNMQKYSTTNG
ncbi:MAG: acyltransferase [Mucilaginibacter polytrichastri]|nr:acyltransferase [Mucilaginibacter polytrichastri]